MCSRLFSSWLYTLAYIVWISFKIVVIPNLVTNDRNFTSPNCIFYFKNLLFNLKECWYQLGVPATILYNNLKKLNYFNLKDLILKYFSQLTSNRSQIYLSQTYHTSSENNATFTCSILLKSEHSKITSFRV
jgi:hypothetical protein